VTRWRRFLCAIGLHEEITLDTCVFQCIHCKKLHLLY
jgi:hypothetical protein